MHKTYISSVSLIAFLAIFAIFTIIIVNSLPVRAAPPSVDLGTATPFAILSGTPNITDAGNASVIQGNVGLSPATGAGIGIVCSQVTGAIYSVDAAGPPCRINNASLLTIAKNDLTAAYIDAAGRTPLTTVPTELGGTTLVAGIYDSSSTTFGITAGAGALVLDGQNDPSSVFIFQAPFNGTGLNVNSGSTVTLTNGAQACNVFWRVNTAAIDTTASFVGTILALNSISVANGATIEGRLLARNGNVTLINDTITVPTCTDTINEDEGEGDGGTGVVIPGFPNTGESSGQLILWIATSTLIVSLGSLLVYIAYKKHNA
jgi:LPXTG-motif cell wall-anchored protein